MKVWAAALALLVAAPAPGEDAFAPADAGGAIDAALEQSVAPERVKLGEPFIRTLVVTHDPAHRFELRPPAEGGDVELLDHQRRREDRGGRATTTFTLELAAFALGTVALPKVQFEVATPEGPRSFESPPAAIEVVPTLAEDEPREGPVPHDIRPPEPVAVPSYTVLWLLLGAAAAAALSYLAWRWWKRPRPQAAPAAPILPPEERARSALDALARQRLPARGRAKDFYVRLSEIVRAYVGERFGVEALECTTFELLARLRDLPGRGLQREELASFLEEADLVKFARATRTEAECDRALGFAYDLVARTTPVVPPPADAARDVR